MRRSAAPSQAGSGPKFVSPFRAPLKPQAPTQNNQVSKVQFSDVGIKVPEKHNSLEISKTSQPSATTVPVETVVQPAKRPRFEPPSSRKTHKDQCQSNSAVNKGHSLHTVSKENLDKKEIPVKRYFNVVWCKRSSKKHKKWEGDAVLVTCGRTVCLYDTEGKEIGKSSGYKSTELESLKEDETLPVGGKEIQVMSVLTEEQFRSGKCFTDSCGDVSGPDKAHKREPVMSRPFSQPLLSVSSIQSVVPSPDPVELKPRHDPSAPGALVMPRPSHTIQWRNGRQELPVVDVVVDPYLTQHLRPHQRDGVTFLYSCIMGYREHSGHGAILADDMGLGKTLQCITLIWTLCKQGPYGCRPVVRKVLIITPGSLVKNWQQEFKKWLGFERLQVFAVGADNKVEEYLKTSIYPVLVISYEMFVRMYDSLHNISFDLVVCDEGHRLKNTAIKTTSLIMGLPTRRRIVLTGTPIQNDLQEFFSIVEFCNPGVLGTSAAFKRVYEDPIVSAQQPGATPAEVALGEDRGAELARKTHMFVLRRTNEINNKYLPPKCEIVVFCRPTALQLSLYGRLLRCQLIRTCLSGGLGGSPHLICIAALKQLCNHPALIHKKAQALEGQDLTAGEVSWREMNSVYEGLLPLFPADFSSDSDLESNCGKLFVLAQLLDQLHSAPTPEKIVLVSNHTKTLDVIQRFCEGRDYRYLRLDGQTPTGRRQELVQRFNSKHSCDFIFLLSSKAGGVGLNLIGASRLVLYDIDWNPANDLQAMARVWRDGQKKKVYIYRLLTTGSIEEKVYQRQICKQGLSGAVMDVNDRKNVQFSLEDLKDLFSVNLHTDCDTHDLLSCDCEAGERREPAKEVATTRTCQLGAKPSVKKRNLGMDELMDWTHAPGSAVLEHSKWHLQEAVEGISFVFHSEVKSDN